MVKKDSKKVEAKMDSESTGKINMLKVISMSDYLRCLSNPSDKD